MLVYDATRIDNISVKANSDSTCSARRDKNILRVYI